MSERSGFDFPLPKFGNLWSEEWAKPFEEYRADLVLNNIWALLGSLDKHINENEPWAIKDEAKLKEVLSYEVDQIRKIAVIIEPFIPDTSKKIWEQYGDVKIKTSEGLFPRKQ